MDTVTLWRRVHTIAAAALLGASGGLLAINAESGHTISWRLAAVAMVVAAWGVVSSRHWAKSVVYALTVALTLWWGWAAVGIIALNGLLGGHGLTLEEAAQFVVAAIGTLAVAGYCCYVVHVYCDLA
jgi:hypothetical protein